jgi:hypothetical protein
MGKELGFCAIHRSGDRVHDQRTEAAAPAEVFVGRRERDEPVGFALGVPDINVVLRDLNGRLTRFGFPIGLLKLLFYKNRIQKGRLVALGVIEKYRRAGIAEVLVLRVVEETMVKRGITVN